MLNKENLLKTNSLPPIVFLYGSDSFSMDEALHNILKNLITSEEMAIDFENIDAEEVDAATVASMAEQVPMMSEKRIIVLRRFNKYFSDRRKKNDTAHS